ncbi:hypothetical protein P7C70_g5623, partial [Phenoliferia sp. Uapishka_3]
MTTSTPQILLCGEVFWAHKEIAELGKTYEILLPGLTRGCGHLVASAGLNDEVCHASRLKLWTVAHGRSPLSSCASRPGLLSIHVEPANIICLAISVCLPPFIILQPLKTPDRDSFLKACAPGGAYSKVVAIYRHGCSASKVGNFDKEIVEGLPSSVKWMAHHGAGYDDVDIKACTAKGIQVAHTPSAVDGSRALSFSLKAYATATVAMYLIIGALRQFYNAEKCARAGTFKKGTTPAHDPELKTLGIVGMGGIGRALAKRALGFDMKIIYHNRNPVAPALLSSFPKDSITYVPTLDALLAASDVVSLHLPLNSATENFFGPKQFEMMKTGSVLVNTARGGVVDEEALLSALESGKIYSAGLDVFPDEPNINPKLTANPRITILPHMGTETEESRLKMENTVIANLKSGLEAGFLINQVPEQKK